MIQEPKLKNVELMTAEDDNETIKAALILQFEEIICSISLNNSKWTTWTKKNEMLKRPLVRSDGGSIYFATAGSSGDKVTRLI